MIRRGRTMLLGTIADEYHALVDVKMNRVRAGMTVAREVDALARQVITERLSKAIGKNVIRDSPPIPRCWAGWWCGSATGSTTGRFASGWRCCATSC